MVSVTGVFIAVWVNGRKTGRTFYRKTDARVRHGALMILEAMVWGELTEYLSDRDLIIAELEKEKQTVGQAGAIGDRT